VNVYTQRFDAPCPRNGKRINYVLKVFSRTAIQVEDLQAFVAALPGLYHEQIADRLFERFGGTQTLNAEHHGTGIQTVRT
jgi:hypothetical protein